MKHYKQFALYTVFALSALVMASPTWAQAISDTLAASLWSMERNTGLGKVTTEMIFNNDGTGKVTRTALKNNVSTHYEDAFSYSIANDRVIIQETIEDQWKGHFGVTRWRLSDGNLVHDVNFRDEIITLRPRKKP